MSPHNNCCDQDNYDCDYDNYDCYDGYDHCYEPQYCFKPCPPFHKPCTGARLSAKLCPCKVVPPSSSCGGGYAHAILYDHQGCAIITIKVEGLTTTAETIAADIHNASTGETNDADNLVKSFTMKRFDVQKHGYGYDCKPCTYCYYCKCKWTCKESTDPLTPTNAELLACGALNIEVAGEIRGQLCHYESSSC